MDLKRRLAVCACSALFAGCESFVLDPPPRQSIRAEAGAVVDAAELVVLTDAETAADEVAVRAARRGYVIESRERLGALGLTLIVLRLPEGRDGPAAIREVESLADGVTAGVNHAYRPQAVPAEGGPSPRLYADTLIGWPEEGCAQRHTIGLIDDGVDGADPAFRAVEIKAMTRSDGSAHGTAVAALLVQGLTGPRRLAVADAVGPSRLGDAAGVDDLTRALGWMAVQEVRIVNVSLAGPYNKILDRAVQRAAGRGMIVVAASGNDGATATARHPAALVGTLAVGAIGPDRTRWHRSIHGDHVDTLAPGVEVWSPSGGGGYRTGTSYAAPHLARWLAASPDGPSDIAAARRHLSAEGSAAPLRVGARCSWLEK